jgi:hypothetical protein
MYGWELDDPDEVTPMCVHFPELQVEARSDKEQFEAR